MSMHVRTQTLSWEHEQDVGFSLLQQAVLWDMQVGS